MSGTYDSINYQMFGIYVKTVLINTRVWKHESRKVKDRTMKWYK